MLALVLKYALLVSLAVMAPFAGTFAQTEDDPFIAWTMMEVIRDVKTSPDGKELMILRAASKEGPYVVEVYPTDNLKAEPVRFGGGNTDIRSAQWVRNGYLYVNAYRDIQKANRFYQIQRPAIIRSDGKGDWVEIESDRVKVGAYFETQLLDHLPDEPNWILISTDINNNRIPDIVRFNIKTGAKATKHRGNTKIPGGFGVDLDGEVRIGSGYDFGENAFKFWVREKGKDDWKHVHSVTPQNRENFDFLGFHSGNPNELIVRANNGEDTAGIYLYDMETDKLSERIFGHPSYDALDVIQSWKKGDRGRIIGFTYIGKYPKTHYIDEDAKVFHDSIRSQFKDPRVSLISRSSDDNVIVIYTQGPKNPGSYYLLRDKSELTFLGAEKPLLTEDMLSDVKFVSYNARDGRKVRAYVTRPKGEAPFPTVVMPHGGPWVRDRSYYDEWAQLLANNGYLVIQPQYRGSRGFGLDHWLAGDAKWGLEMQDDLDDAARFLIDRGLADPERVAMHGYSYGGYAAFVAAHRAGGPFTCSISGAGVSDLRSVGAEFTSNRFLKELQKPTIKGISPVDHTADVYMPILIMHGDRDVIVPVKHSQWFVDGLKKNNKHHKYIEIEGMRHQGWTWTFEHKQIYYSNMIDWLDNTCFK